MPEPSRSGKAGADRGGRPPTGLPGWAMVFGLAALVLLAVLVTSLLVGGRHGPGRDTPRAADVRRRELTPRLRKLLLTVDVTTTVAAGTVPFRPRHTALSTGAAGSTAARAATLRPT